MVAPVNQQNQQTQVQDLDGEQTDLFVGANNKELYEKKNLYTSVPYKLFQVDNPNMRVMNEHNIKKQPYSNWTETQFFKYDQVQEVICTEYPDERWTIDQLNGHYFKKDINNLIQNHKKGYGMEL